MAVVASGSPSERLYFEHRALDYDLEFLIDSENGSVDFVVRVNDDGEPVRLLLALPTSRWTKARVKFIKGTVTLFLDDKEYSSQKLPVPTKPDPNKQESFGFIAGNNSTAKIASIRFREPY